MLCYDIIMNIFRNRNICTVQNIEDAVISLYILLVKEDIYTRIFYRPIGFIFLLL